MNFQLVQKNPRILALSHKGVVRPLELAFPYAIDKLQADEGHRDGEKPVVVDDVPLEVQLLNPRQSQTHTLGPQRFTRFVEFHLLLGNRIWPDMSSTWMAVTGQMM